MIKVFLLFFLLGVVASYRSRQAIRAHNRRMFETMQRKGPVHLWPLIWLSGLGAIAAAALHFLNPHS